ncbi:hypothetical protein [Gephyromycinifex aptenodytis]|uniref:hypothetical protein n=1 Tax=Gephyromycinifex aptenodytis TaxID=2716227 RepID=UPI001444E164|nr:hypothetical protein [Gephyromycinifex aptenodytis]
MDDKGGVGAHKDLTAPACAADANGVWGFSGKVDNSTKTAQDYTVEVSVVDPNGWSVLGSTSVTASVEPGQTAPVVAKGFHRESPAEAAKHQCVTRVVRHQG